MRISDWSSDVCSSDLEHHEIGPVSSFQRPDRAIEGGGSAAADPLQQADADRRAGTVGQHRPPTGEQALAVLQPAQLLGRVDRDMAVGADTDGATFGRSEERRVGKARVSAGSFRWWPSTTQKKKTH